MGRPEIVFHLAGLATGARERDLILPTFESNLRSTVNLLLAASEAGGVRVVLPGSLEEPEAADAVASSPYAMSKWAVVFNNGVVAEGVSGYLRKHPVVLMRLTRRGYCAAQCLSASFQGGHKAKWGCKARLLGEWFCICIIKAAVEPTDRTEMKSYESVISLQELLEEDLSAICTYLAGEFGTMG